MTHQYFMSVKAEYMVDRRTELMKNVIRAWLSLVPALHQKLLIYGLILCGAVEYYGGCFLYRCTREREGQTTGSVVLVKLVLLKRILR